jgi:isoleucyl-tRNA synthetase
MVSRCYGGKQNMNDSSTDGMLNLADFTGQEQANTQNVLMAGNLLEHVVGAVINSAWACRGWFQSSLLTSVATKGHAPYKAVLTHGFVLDEKGNKMSKSLGNVVNPLLVIEGGKDQKKEPAYGADVLRLWVASVDYTADVSIGANILKQVFESYRKLRGTLRFMLGNVHDFDPSAHAVPHSKLPLMDRHMLHCFGKLVKVINAGFDSFNFGSIYRALNVFLAVDLSSRYFELSKDRLYIRGADAFERQSCQTVLHIILTGLLTSMAPLTPHTCEDAWQHLPFPSRAGRSVFQAGPPTADPIWEISSDDVAAAERALLVKDVALKALEAARNQKMIRAALDAHVLLHVEDVGACEKLAALNSSDNGVDALKWLFVTSQVSVVADAAHCVGDHMASEEVEGLGTVTAAVVRADGERCERCWNRSLHVGEDNEHPQLCERCLPVVRELGFASPVAPQEAAPTAA